MPFSGFVAGQTKWEINGAIVFVIGLLMLLLRTASAAYAGLTTVVITDRGPRDAETRVSDAVAPARIQTPARSRPH